MNVSHIIDKLYGGTARAAEHFGVKPSAVSNWKAADRFPPRLHYRIAKDAEREGFRIPAKIFEVEPSRPLSGAGGVADRREPA